MNRRNHDPFDILFQKAQVDLPDHLKHRLLSIPRTVPSVSFWDSRTIFPIIAMVPGFVWLLFTQSGPFWKWLGIQLVALSGALPAASTAGITATTLYIGTGVLMLSVLTATWLFLRHGQRAQINYVRQLTSAV